MRNSNDLQNKSAPRRFNDSKNQNVRKTDQLKATTYNTSAKAEMMSTAHDTSARSNLQSEHETRQLRAALCEAIEEN